MARIRTIVPEFWEDERFSNVSLPALLLYIGMKNFATDDGVITSNPVILKSKVFPAREDVRRQQVSQWLQELTENSVLVPLIYEGKGYYVMDFSSERIDKPKRSGIPQDIIDKAVSNYANPAANGEVSGTFATIRDDSRQVENIRDDSRQVENIRDDSRQVETILAGEERKGEERERKGQGDGINARTRATPTLQDEDFSRFKQWMAANAANVDKLREPITREQYARIRAEFPPEVVADTLLAMHNYKDLQKKYVSAYLTFRRWAKRDMENGKRDKKPSAGDILDIMRNLAAEEGNSLR